MPKSKIRKTKTSICDTLIYFEEVGYGRYKRCPKCGNNVSPETIYQKTKLCHALVCSKCGRAKSPVPLCRCTVDSHQ